MKMLLTLVCVLSFSTAFAANRELNSKALATLLSSSGLRVEGDILEGESVSSIYKLGIASHAKIENECVLLESKIANCTLWITNPIIGETAIQYNVSEDGSALLSSTVLVSRGD